jgi:flagellar motor protein MotB
VDGQVAKQSSSYRQGLVLGLTMAEVMMLLIFCLLIAMAAYLRSAQTRLAAAEARPNDQGISIVDRDILDAVKRDDGLYEKLRTISATSNPKAIDEYWRDVTTDRSLAEEYRKLGSPNQVRQKVELANALLERDLDGATAVQDVAIAESVKSAMLKGGQPPNPESVKEVVARGVSQGSSVGHQWPPIISLSEANGHFFKTGSAELSLPFRQELETTTPERILELVKQYDVDVIEVVGHTDQQPIAGRISNLDANLGQVLRNEVPITSLVPSDNAGLGLARAVSVVSVLRKSELLDGYKLIPLSGAQLVNTDETLAIGGISGDIPERRRIEIRLRKSSPDDTVSSISDVPLPRPKPVFLKPKVPTAHQSPNSPLPIGPIH